MARLFLLLAAVSGFLGVALGAFGAHALKLVLSEEYRAIWVTAVHYQLVHTLALLGVALLSLLQWQTTPQQTSLPVQLPALQSALNVAGWSFIAGIALFSGSLYTLCLTGLRWLGAVTPLGGLALLSGWVALFTAALSLKTRKT